MEETAPVAEEIKETKEELPVEIASEGTLVKSFDKEDQMKGKNIKIVLAIFLMVILGVISGYGLSLVNRQRTSSGGVTTASGEKIAQGQVVGSKDESTFKDSAEGILEKGGVNGEGSHHLVRPGGDSQTVYLTSSILDLDTFVNRKVKVWGETFAAQKAGWLMDVGRLKVVE